jgi:pSer/pThr/pTyr-binding forkhead associated (FHA) protein
MNWQLLVERGHRVGTTIPIQGPLFAIGRDSHCHLRPTSRKVSRRHCELSTRGGRLFVWDCLAANGTIVNGRRISGEVELSPGDRLQVGPLLFIVRQQSGPSEEGIGVGTSEETVGDLLLHHLGDNIPKPGQPTVHCQDTRLDAATGIATPTPLEQGGSRAQQILESYRRPAGELAAGDRSAARRIG